MSGHKIIVVGASAGGVEALSQWVSLLPANLPASIFVVVHHAENSPSVLFQILDRSGPLPVVQPVDGQEIELGKIYVAPPDEHMRIEKNTIRLARTPRENGQRPSIDPLFRSAALHYGRSVVGIVLTGMLDDGTAGLIAISKRGGITIAQDPAEAMFSSMPQSAIDHDHISMILSIREIALQIALLARSDVTRQQIGEADHGRSTAHIGGIESDGDGPTGGIENGDGGVFPYICPECQGPLIEIQAEALRFECNRGHCFTAASLLASQTDALEAGLWTALRAVEDSAALSRRLQAAAVKDSRTLTGTRFGDQADEMERHADTLREVLMHNTIHYPDVGGLELRR